MSWYQRFTRIKTAPWLADILAAIGGIIYFAQSWAFAHTQVSILDEGAYLLKGYLFATGKYWPFQDYGPWTNHMPLSFLIPGWVQVLFGPGLRTGRYFAIALGAVMLIGVWLVSRRFGNRWWSAALIWFLAVNIPVLKVYSLVTSQGLVACMLVWVLVLILGPDRPGWQVYLGAVLAGLMMLTRINMTPLLPFLLVYIFWEHGKKTGAWALVAVVLTVGIGHAFFWPGILKLWTAWLPIEDFSFLDTWRSPGGAKSSWNPKVSMLGRLSSFLLGYRIHFFAFTIVLISMLMWPPKRLWRSEWRFKIAIFFLVSFMVLTGFHAWASLGKNYCVYCFPNYLMFFQILGVLLGNVVFTSWDVYKERFGRMLPIITMLMVMSGMVYHAVEGKRIFKTWGGGWLRYLLGELWRINVPRVRSLKIEPGTVEIWALFANKFGWDKDQVINSTFIIVWLLIVSLVFYFGIKWAKKIIGKAGKVEFSTLAIGMFLFLFLGTGLSLRIGPLSTGTDCNGDVISSYEIGGAYLADNIPPGSKIYWNGGLSTVPLLYLTDREIYPPQINSGYSYRLGGDPDELLRYGLWNEEIAQAWQQEADVVLVEGGQGEWEDDAFDEIMPTPPMYPCQTNNEIHIYIRK